jgi:hypothetical protein
MLEDSSGIPVMMESIVVSIVAIASPTIYLTHMAGETNTSKGIRET